ncbi:MAG: hypothetical protein ACRDRY_21030 [Pseudonocardiaceae bacterium]
MLGVPAVQGQMQAGQQEVVDGGPGIRAGGQRCGVRGVEDEVMDPVAGTVLAPAGNKVH